MKEIFGSRQNAEIISDLITELKRTDEVGMISVYNKYLPFFWLERSAFTARNLYQSALKELSVSKMSKAKKEAIKRLLTLDTSFFMAINKGTQEREIERMNDKTEFSVEGFIGKMMSLKQSIINKEIKGHGVQSDAEATANALAVYVAMATGRRSFEILNSLHLVKDRSGVYFTGLAKKGENEERYVAILLDDDYQFIKKALETIRKTLGTADLTADQINTKYSRILPRAARKLLDEEVTMHTLRERYAEVCVLTKKPENIDTELYREMVLGHEIKLKASDFYKSQKGVK